MGNVWNNDAFFMMQISFLMSDVVDWGIVFSRILSWWSQTQLPGFPLYVCVYQFKLFVQFLANLFGLMNFFFKWQHRSLRKVICGEGKWMMVHLLLGRGRLITPNITYTNNAFFYNPCETLPFLVLSCSGCLTKKGLNNS